MNLRSCAPSRAVHAGSAWRLVVWAAVLAFGAGMARAHDPFEITADVRVRAEALTVDVAMARSTALAIASDVAEAPTFDPTQFAEHRAAFLARAPNLFVLSSPQGLLTPSHAEVGLSVEGDVEFHLTYPSPATGPLHLEAPHLAKLGRGFGDVVRVRGPTGESLADKLLGAADPTLEFAVPATASPVPTAVAPSGRLRRGAAVIAALAMLALLWWSNRHRAAPTLAHHDG
jgi:hypothetical protein